MDVPFCLKIGCGLSFKQIPGHNTRLLKYVTNAPVLFIVTSKSQTKRLQLGRKAGGGGRGIGVCASVCVCVS